MDNLFTKTIRTTRENTEIIVSFSGDTLPEPEAYLRLERHGL